MNGCIGSLPLCNKPQIRLSAVLNAPACHSPRSVNSTEADKRYLRTLRFACLFAVHNFPPHHAYNSKPASIVPNNYLIANCPILTVPQGSPRSARILPIPRMQRRAHPGGHAKDLRGSGRSAGPFCVCLRPTSLSSPRTEAFPPVDLIWPVSAPETAPPSFHRKRQLGGDSVATLAATAAEKQVWRGFVNPPSADLEAGGALRASASARPVTHVEEAGALRSLH